MQFCFISTSSHGEVEPSRNRPGIWVCMRIESPKIRSVPHLGLRFGSLRTTSKIHGYSINRKIYRCIRTFLSSRSPTLSPVVGSCHEYKSLSPTLSPICDLVTLMMLSSILPRGFSFHFVS